MEHGKIKLWEKRIDESEKAFAAFKTYLEMENRTLLAVGKKCGKSRSLIDRWATKFDWKNRAIAWDNSLLEELRTKEKQKLVKTICRQLNDLEDFQKKAVESLKKKDLSKASVKSLSEMYHDAFQAHWNLFEKLGVFETKEVATEDVIITLPEKKEKI